MNNRIIGTGLVVDDDIGCRLIAKFLLSHIFCKIVTATTAEESLEYLQKYSHEVSLILLDINLPQMTGLECLSEIKRNYYFKNIPVIVQTGDTTVNSSKCLKLGASFFIFKPYTKETLYSSIKQIKSYDKLYV